MGSMSAYDMAEHADLDTGLRWHLQYNHFPPLPLELLPAAKQAIELFNAGDTEGPVELPDGVTYRGSSTAPAYKAIEEWHLYAWLEDDGDGEDTWIEDEEE